MQPANFDAVVEAGLAGGSADLPRLLALFSSPPARTIGEFDPGLVVKVVKAVYYDSAASPDGRRPFLYHALLGERLQQMLSDDPVLARHLLDRLPVAVLGDGGSLVGLLAEIGLLADPPKQLFLSLVVLAIRLDAAERGLVKSRLARLLAYIHGAVDRRPLRRLLCAAVFGPFLHGADGAVGQEAAAGLCELLLQCSELVLTNSLASLTMLVEYGLGELEQATLVRFARTLAPTRHKLALLARLVAKRDGLDAGQDRERLVCSVLKGELDPLSAELVLCHLAVRAERPMTMTMTMSLSSSSSSSLSGGTDDKTLRLARAHPHLKWPGEHRDS